MFSGGLVRCKNAAYNRSFEWGQLCLQRRPSEDSDPGLGCIMYVTYNHHSLFLEGLLLYSINLDDPLEPRPFTRASIHPLNDFWNSKSTSENTALSSYTLTFLQSLLVHLISDGPFPTPAVPPLVLFCYRYTHSVQEKRTAESSTSCRAQINTNRLLYSFD